MARFKRRLRRGKSTFRSKVEAKVIDELLYRFVSLVRKGLELMLTEPSELAATEFRKHPEYSYTAGDIPALTLWVAEGVYEIPRSEFCQHVLANPEWSELLGVSSQADLERWFDRIAGWENIPFRAIELAVHDGLKEGDKRDLRPVAKATGARRIRRVHWCLAGDEAAQKEATPVLETPRCARSAPSTSPTTYLPYPLVLVGRRVALDTGIPVHRRIAP